MFKLLFGFFLTIHLLGDFYFQSDKLSEKKRNGYCYVLLHGLIYFLISFACAIPFWSIPCCFLPVLQLFYILWWTA